MAKKQKKSREEKIAEEYFPLNKEDIHKSIEIPVLKAPPEEEIRKGAVEVEYIKPEKEKIEIIENKVARIKKSRKGKINRKKDYSPKEISLKGEGYELIITEKPQAALKISDALGENPVKKSVNGVPYYEIRKNGKEIVVACAVGHLFTLAQKVSGSGIPVFDIGWIPNFLARKKDFSKKYHDIILKLAKGAGSVTVATDYDVEGEVIGMNVVRFICGQKDASRMKFSTLTEKELNDSYENKNTSINWGQAIAGETRHYLDWIYGINLSRALMNAIKTTGKFRIMSVGRVQGPALNLIVKKEEEINAFKPTIYWQVFIIAEDGEKKKIELKYEKDIFEKSELKKFENIVGKEGDAENKKTENSIQPNAPFNLTNLQTESYRIYGISPSKTLQIAQSLYLAGLISYPRTSSQKLPASIGYEDILKKIAKKYNAEKLIKRKMPVEGKKSDPAHPSIYPTGNFQILAGEEEKIYDIIARRFLSVFCEEAIVSVKTIKIKTDEMIFSARGASIKQKGWAEIYPVKIVEKEIPDIEGKVKITESRIEEKETNPPKRYTPASLISELEKRNLGTKATRASIIETLYSRMYIKENSIEATKLGMSLINTLKRYSPIIIDEELTRKFEDEMESIQKLKEGFIEKEKQVIEKAKENIIGISEQFEKNNEKIGKELLEANAQLKEEEKKKNTLNKCPLCQEGNLIINYSKKTRRNFVACTGYPECKNTYSLPPNGMIKKSDKICEECGFSMLMRLKKGSRPWVFCFNRECKTNKERIEEYYRKKENNQSSKEE